MATATITILLPFGRRQTIKATPNTSILQILEDVCRTQKLNPEEFDLVHQRKPLDLSLTVRFANLPNNVSLELLPTISGSKTEDQLVTVALQLESSERLVAQFKSSLSLWAIIQYWEEKRGGKGLNENCSGDPICVFMRNEVIGEENLKLTTLRRLGITNGKVIIRLNYKDPASLKEQANSYDLQISKKSKVESEPPLKDVNKTFDNLITNQPITSNDSNTAKPACVSLSEHKSEKAYEPIITQKPIQVEKHSSHSDEEPQEMEICDPITSRKEEEVVKELPEEEEKIIYLGARNAILFDMESVPAIPRVDLPDEFFHLTVDDVRYLYSDLQRQRREVENKPLQLESKRESMKQAKNVSYKQTVLRIQFPDRYVLQAHFTPNETVSDVIDFLKEFLENPELDFHLYTAPPKLILTTTVTLAEAGLVPAALIHFGSENSSTNFLSATVKAKVSTLAAASKKAAILRSTAKDSEFSSSSVEENLNSLPSTSTHSLLRDQSGLDNVNSIRPATKNPPKWFKLGK